ncbi:hypothetical protein MCW82_07225 [Azospirillum doebereinerae]|uniref:hypothetical protein n=1 Tax=Azospirillum doebereinerae TaxID=92933 RepID=UPI001EE5A723|nr:hypothetical protein [Azospirillum doebereinerae]MCG5239559.1 hypothetical protein [Azospirillum doebereinerae]
MMFDSNGKAYASVAETKEGTVLVADAGFTCIESGAELTVQSDPVNGLYVSCGDGKHFLDGQCDDHTAPDAFYVGLYPKPAA